MKFRNPFRKKDISIDDEKSDEIISDYKAKEQMDKKHSDEWSFKRLF